MAVVTASVIQDAFVAHTISGLAPMIKHYTCAAGSAFEKGQFVKIDAGTGFIEEYSGDSTVLGLAEAAADPGNRVPVTLCTPDVIFSVIWNVGDAFNDYAANDIGTVSRIQVNGSGVHGLASATGTNPALKVGRIDYDRSDVVEGINNDGTVYVFCSVQAAYSEAPGCDAVPT